MRLLYRENGKLQFIERDATTRYAILSHTWDKDEVTYTDVLDGRSGRKLEFTLQQAEQDGLRYVWIDSCCIDRRYGPELGEAINSMFRWYADAEVCYAYLADVPEKSFVASRWHTRGWTLQELLAPDIVRFYDCNGDYLGDRMSLAADILVASGVQVDVPLPEVPLADRMRWSEKRLTKRPEDASYCMLGLMEVPLLFNYGEGAEAARARLLKAVGKKHGKRTGDALLQKAPADPCSSIESLREALAFDGMRLRHQAISSPYKGTCEWLSEVKEYKEWLAGDRRMIWIKGRPGTGKSTLLKHIEERAPGISFYFNARGGQLEHSVFGMYRSLLFQLLDHGIGEQILAYVRKQIRDCLPWLSQLSLQQSLQHAAGLLERSKPFRCYVDALDECDQQEIQQMVRLLEDSNLYVCFASRHYPAIVLRSASIEMAGNDLATFVRGRLLPGLADQVIQKANGIFFWAVIVVDMLNEGHVRGIEDDINALPGTLDGLLESVIERKENKEMFDLAMCLLFHNLSNRIFGYEFCGFMQLGTSVKILDDRAYVHNVTRGLATIEVDTVQPVHETVREVMLKTWSKHHSDVAGWAHEQVARLCIMGYDLSLTRDYTRECMLKHIERSSSPGLFLQRPGFHRVLFSEQSLFPGSYNVAQFLLLRSCINLLGILLSLTDATQETLLEPDMRFTPDDLDLHRLMPGSRTTIDLWMEKGQNDLVAAGLKLLLRHGVDMEQVDGEGCTPLLRASRSAYYTHELSLLVQHGANIHARDLLGQSGLHCAQSREVAEILIAAGADPLLCNRYGRTAIEHHIERCSNETAKAILKHTVYDGISWKQQRRNVIERYARWAVDVAVECRLTTSTITHMQIMHLCCNEAWNCTMHQSWWATFGRQIAAVSDGPTNKDLDILHEKLKPHMHFVDGNIELALINILLWENVSDEIYSFIWILLDQADYPELPRRERPRSTDTGRPDQLLREAIWSSEACIARKRKHS